MAGRENLIALAGCESIKTLNSVRNRMAGCDESMATVSERMITRERTMSNVRTFLIRHDSLYSNLIITQN